MSKFRESWTGNAIKEASEEMVNKFCDIDYHNEIAVIAESDSNGEKRNVGVVRLFIAIGRERGLKSVYGIVMADNTKMLTLAKELGFSVLVR